ncbi:MAG: hypothetical protein Q8O95_00970 [bacterium]|nr:hypothetical protein [bacterium]
MEIIDKLIALSESPFVDIAIKGSLIYLAALWFAMVVWVARDIIHRSNNILFQVSMILLNLVMPVFGLILYMIIRPSKTLLEKYYDEMEYSFLSEQAGEHQDENCPRCEKKVSQDFLYCPSCTEQIRNSCWSCSHIYLHEYLVCPYCGKKEKSRPLKTTKKTEELVETVKK